MNPTTSGWVILTRTLVAGFHPHIDSKRKRVEEIFGWMKTVGGLRRSRFIGIERTGLWAYLVGAAYKLVRMTRLALGPPTQVAAD